MSEFGGEGDLGLDVAGAPASGGLEGRRGGAEEAFENGHDEEHGDENGGGDEAEGDGVDGGVEVGPMVVSDSVDVEWGPNGWPGIGIGIGVFFNHHFCC